MLRMEDRIRGLCSELLAEKSDEELTPIFVELREALHVHIERMRLRFGAYPFLVDRRARYVVPPIHEQCPEDRAKKPSQRDTVLMVVRKSR